MLLKFKLKEGETVEELRKRVEKSFAFGVRVLFAIPFVVLIAWKIVDIGSSVNKGVVEFQTVQNEYKLNNKTFVMEDTSFKKADRSDALFQLSVDYNQALDLNAVQ